MSKVNEESLADIMSETLNDEVKEEVTETSNVTEEESHDIEDDVKNEENPYKAELETLQEKLERERETRKYEREKRKEYQKKLEDVSSDVSMGADIESKIASILDEKLNPILQKVDQDKLDAEVSKVTTDPHKAELVKYHLENSVRRTGSLQEDLKKAEILADSVAYRKNIEEKVRKSEAKKFAAKGGVRGGGRPQQYEEKPVLSPEEASILRHMKQITGK